VVEYRSYRFESAKKVGAHRPTNIPKRSPWAGSGDFDVYQMMIEAMIDAKPAMKQKALTDFNWVEFMFF